MATAISPADYGIEADFVNWSGDPAEDHMGPFFYRWRDGQLETAFRISQHHCNSFGITHGGLLMAFADYTLCLAAMGENPSGCLTISCNSEFLGPSRTGDLLRGIGETTGGGRKLRFARAQLFSGDRPVLNASAAVKLMPRDR